MTSKFDRFGRYLVHLLRTLCHLQALGDAFARLTEALEIPIPGGRVLFALLACLVDFERDVTREWVREGLSPRPH